MATDILMPNLGFDTQSGSVLEWYKQPGDTVTKGEVIALVEADKSNVELESLASGIVLEILVPTDQEVDVGTIIARVGTANEKISDRVSATPTPTAAAPSSATPSETQMRISPVAQKLAEENNLDLTRILGSGMRGRIMRRDVEAHLQTTTLRPELVPKALPKVRKAAREAGIDLRDLEILDRPITMVDMKAFQEEQTQSDADVSQTTVVINPQQDAPEQPAASREGATAISLSRMRKRIGERLVQSKQSAPHFYVTGEFDLTDAIARLADYKAGINDLLQYVTVQALLQVPELNAHLDGDTLYTYENVHLAIAVAVETGLMTPIIANADHYSLNGLAQQSRDLIRRTRDNKLTPRDMQAGTFTISNLGIVPQVEHFTAIINPPQVGILAVGTVKERPVVMNGGFHARQTVHMTLSGDHRAVDGMHLARFMATYQSELEKFTR